MPRGSVVARSVIDMPHELSANAVLRLCIYMRAWSSELAPMDGERKNTSSWRPLTDHASEGKVLVQCRTHAS